MNTLRIIFSFELRGGRPTEAARLVYSVFGASVHEGTAAALDVSATAGFPRACSVSVYALDASSIGTGLWDF